MEPFIAINVTRGKEAEVLCDSTWRMGNENHNGMGTSKENDIELENENHANMDGMRTSMRTDGTTIDLEGNKEVPLSMVGDKSSKSSLKRTRAEKKSEKVPQKLKTSHKMKTILSSHTMKTTFPSIKQRQPWMTANVLQDKT